MFYRVTPNQKTQFATSHLQSQASKLLQTQRELSTGVRVHSPSDDPIAMRRSLIQKDSVTRLETQLTSISHSEARLNQAHVQLREAQQLFVKSRELALSAVQSTDEAERRVMATEIQGILDQLVSVANSADASGFLFSGTASSTRPFDVSSGTGSTVAYAGTSDATNLHLTNDVSRDALLPGDRIFQPNLREATLLLGISGAAVGTGIDTARGTRELIVTHTATTYAGATGVAAGTSSVGGDTAIGATGTHQLTIVDTSGTGASGTVSLNGGAEVAFTSADTDLEVTGPNGEIVYVDTTAIVAGTSTTIDITSDGTLSIDGGLTSQPITFTSNQVIVDSRDDSVVNIDTTSLTKAATDKLEFPGTSDAFRVLEALRDQLLNVDNLSSGDLQTALGRRLEDVERIETHLLDEVGVQAVALEQLDRLTTRTEDLTLYEEAAYTETVTADLAEATISLQEQLNLQQFTMATVGQLLSQNLLDFLN
jgi:flagellar hook-associated protein 3